MDFIKRLHGSLKSSFLIMDIQVVGQTEILIAFYLKL